MRPFDVEALPSRTLRTFSVALKKLFAAVYKDIMLAGNIKYFLGFQALEYLRQSVKFFRH